MTTTVTFAQQTLHSTKHLPSAVLLNRHVLTALLEKTEAFLAWVNKTAVKNHTLLSEIERDPFKSWFLQVTLIHL